MRVRTGRFESLRFLTLPPVGHQSPLSTQSALLPVFKRRAVGFVAEGITQGFTSCYALRPDRSGIRRMPLTSSCSRSLTLVQSFASRCGLDGPDTGLSGRRRRAWALASVRRPNCTCSFLACSFHVDVLRMAAIEGINPIRLTSPNPPYSMRSGSRFQPALRHRLKRRDRCAALPSGQVG